MASNLKGDASSSNSNQQEHVVKSMDPAIYRALTTCDINGFRRVTQDIEAVSLMAQLTPQGNTVLHLAAISGCDELVEVILQRCPNLLLSENSMGSLAYHDAASAGHLSTLRILARCSPSNLDWPEVENIDGDNPLHLAIKNGHKEAAMLLVETCQKASFNPNKEHKSPFYMAAKLGFVDIIKAVIEKHQGDIVTTDPDLRSVVHAALTVKNLEILKAILCKDSTLINLKDEHGMTVLSYAAFTGYQEGVDYLLDNHTQTVYQANQNGFFPIHTASANGHITIIKKFLAKCPDSIECVNSKGQNIIHVAAMIGKSDVISYLLKLRLIEKLINQRDADGNTPLHLAAMNWHRKIVRALTRDKRVSTALVNSEGMTALDAAEKYTGINFSIQKRLTLNALLRGGASRAQRSSPEDKAHLGIESPQSAPMIQKYKDMVHILLVVATLVATVTFAAGFTVPGGYNSSSDPLPGMATLHEDLSFHSFVICDTLALYMSIIVAIMLIYAQLDDLVLTPKFLRFAMLLVALSLLFMSLAFMTGVSLVVTNLQWLASTVLVVATVFVMIIIILFFFPVCSDILFGFVD